jgi:hypothetical protein
VRQNLPEIEPIKLVYDEKVEKDIENAVNLFNKFVSCMNGKH